MPQTDWWNNFSLDNLTKASEVGLGLLEGYLGYRGLKLGEDQLKTNQKQFALNYGAQRTSYNASRQNQANAENAYLDTVNQGHRKKTQEQIDSQKIKAYA